jgi:thioredoxin-dependent peroxiredoxin
MLKIGDTAPLNINIFDEQENSVNLKQLLGSKSVIYFYPKDNTPGCTKEACSFRDYNIQLKKIGVKVIGISADSVKSHQNFKEKHQLNFELWSDPEKKLIQAFGAIGEKNMFGKKFLGIKRSTFALDETGKIIKVWTKVNTETHAQEIFDFFANL